MENQSLNRYSGGDGNRTLAMENAVLWLRVSKNREALHTIKYISQESRLCCYFATAARVVAELQKVSEGSIRGGF
jgi:hypothetical protein